MAKKFTRTQIAAVREVLCSLMPNTFAPKGMPKKPLAIGIHMEVISRVKAAHPETKVHLIRATMSDYVDGIRYQECLVAGAVRYDADGNPCGSVDETGAAAAIKAIAKMRENERQARRAKAVAAEDKAAANV